MRQRSLSMKTALIAVFAVAAAPSYAKPDTPAAVNATAQMVCARCHEVGTAIIPNRKIGDGTPPAFVMIAQDPKMTPEALRRYIRFPHGAMDNVFITQRETDALVAYIQSLKPAPDKRPDAP
ncbi:MAG: hypothetical protein AB7I36_16585 [Rhodospirillaceae bacterium]